MAAADRPLTLAAAILIPGRIVEGRRQWSRHSDFADVDEPTTDGQIDHERPTALPGRPRHWTGRSGCAMSTSMWWESST
jgi:hypothetical protein